MFVESTLFLQKLKIFKNNVALFWWLSRGSSKSHATTASSRVDFGDLFASERSNREWYTEIFVAQLATPSRVDLPIAKNTKKFFSQFYLWVFWRLALATCFSREKCVFCISKIVFKTFSVFFSLKFLWLFTVFPISFSTETDPNTPLTPFLHHFLSNLQEKVWVFSISLHFPCFESAFLVSMSVLVSLCFWKMSYWFKGLFYLGDCSLFES